MRGKRMTSERASLSLFVVICAGCINKPDGHENCSGFLYRLVFTVDTISCLIWRISQMFCRILNLELDIVLKKGTSMLRHSIMNL